MTFEEFVEKFDVIFSKVTPEELTHQLEELGYPIESIDEESIEQSNFYLINFFWI